MNLAELQECLLVEGYPWVTVPPHHGTFELLSGKEAGGRLIVSGQIAFKDGRPISGRVGVEFDIDNAMKAAETAAAYAFFAAASVIDDVDRIVGVNKLMVYVRCGPDFHNTSLVAEGASRLLVAVLGKNGQHARTAIGVYTLPPNGSPVEIEVEFELAPTT